MSDVLVVYYSLDGDVRYVAKALAQGLGADWMELELVTPHPERGFMKYFKGGFLAATGATPPLRPLAHRAANYDMVFVGTPVWNSRPAPAVRTFLKGADLAGKRIAFFACYGDSEGKTFRLLDSLVPGAQVIGHIGFTRPLKNDREQCAADIVRWATELLTD